MLVLVFLLVKELQLKIFHFGMYFLHIRILIINFCNYSDTNLEVTARVKG